jgi:putative flippase GtrA
MSPPAATRRQLLRYAVTGLAANALLYAAYWLLTSHGVGHKVAMTTTYCTSVLCTFIFNRRWTFQHGGAVPSALLRYVATYIIGYMVNLAALTVLVDVGGLPHRWVMAMLIALSAVLIFLAQKYWVFRTESASHGLPHSIQ